MRLYGIGRMKLCLRQVRAFLQARAAILMYHRVFDTPADPWHLCVSPEHFGEHMQYISQHYPVLHLRELGRVLQDRRLPKRAVVVTFDDGYADNLWNAKPILERYAVPATVFVTTGYIGLAQEFWWDELERLLFLTPVLPERLRVSLHDSVYEWNLCGWERLPLVGGALAPQWLKRRADDLTPRHRAYKELHRLLRPLGAEEREVVLEMLRSQAGSNGRGRSDYRALTQEEISQLAKGGLVEIGAHTVTHPVLSVQPPDRQRWEMAESKRCLEAIFGQTVTTCCYPYGGQRDVSSTTAQLAQEIGFDVACSTVQRPVTYADCMYWLPRFAVLDWDKSEFARRLQMFFRL